MTEEMDLDALHRRLHKIIGQCNGIGRMIDRNASCKDIILQVSAAKNALHKVGQILLAIYLNDRVKQAMEAGTMEGLSEDFGETIEYFCRMRK